jgi:tetratricopeptide (TPR) repeat protein
VKSSAGPGSIRLQEI